MGGVHGNFKIDIFTLETRQKQISLENGNKTHFQSQNRFHFRIYFTSLGVNSFKIPAQVRKKF